MGDDPILWREKYTTRENAFTKALGVLIFGGLMIGLAAGAFHFARPAFVEVWRHGYGSAGSANSEYVMNFLVQLFKPSLSPGGPVDAARVQFNNFIRGTTIGIVVVMTFLVGGFASEILAVERMKETWTSLLATPMTGREIARSAIRATAWRSRWGFGTVIVLWTLGLAAGAIHPLGYVVSLLILAAFDLADGHMRRPGVDPDRASPGRDGPVDDPRHHPVLHRHASAAPARRSQLGALGRRIVAPDDLDLADVVR